MVRLRQSAAHNWPVASTQPLGNIQIFTRFSLLVTKRDKKAYSRLFTNSILGYREGRGGLAWRAGSVGAGRPQQRRGSKLARPQARGSARHWAPLLGKEPNFSCGGTSFCCLWTGERRSEKASVPTLGTALTLSVRDRVRKTGV